MVPYVLFWLAGMYGGGRMWVPPRSVEWNSNDTSRLLADRRSAHLSGLYGRVYMIRRALQYDVIL